MFTKKFWQDALERIISTTAQAFLGALGGATLLGDLHWDLVFSATGIAALACFVKCLIAQQKGDPTSASLTE
jgi:hypothetical protein